MEEAIDALGSDLSIRLSRREEIPAPSRAKQGQRMVPPAILVRAEPFYRAGKVDLLERGIDPKHAEDRRQRLAMLAKDGDRPEMDAYDELPLK